MNRIGRLRIVIGKIDLFKTIRKPGRKKRS